MYKLVCGIETHIELLCETKIFCSCRAEFGGEPNTRCCPVCTGQAGALPVLNRKAVELAIKAGLAVNCRINRASHMDRKNYFYPDLPKAYQISQFDEPLCVDGYIELDSGKRIGIERIHIEEDAGKLIHENGYTYIDYNRGGVALIEVVSRADIETPEEAKEYAEKLQLIMRSAGISDCKMQEGSMRCDVNVSIHKDGEEWGTRTEIKNIGSLTGVMKAIRLEAKRQEQILENGGKIVQSTMRYDEDNARVYVLRTKENSDDYRYFPEPDTVRFSVSDEEIENIRKTLPELPDEKLRRYVNEMKLPENKVRLIYKYKNATAFFDEAVSEGASAENALNLIIATVYATLKTEAEKEKFNLKISAKQFSQLVKLADEKKIKINKAKEILPKMLETGKSATDFISSDDMSGMDEASLIELCQRAVEANQKAVEDIKSGKDKAINALFGFIMKESRGKADIKEAERIIREIIGK